MDCRKREAAISCALAFAALFADGCQATTQTNGSSTPPPTLGYFSTEPSHVTYLPRSDSYCASAVSPNSWEPRSDNNQANHTVLSPPYNWDAENYWTKWADKRAKVTGNFTGTTTEIIQSAACKWGIDEDTIRAAAVQESYWHMNTIGDVCGPVGEASYGLLQIKNMDCSGTMIQGGYPDTLQATALNATGTRLACAPATTATSMMAGAGSTWARRSIRSRRRTDGAMFSGAASASTTQVIGRQAGRTNCK
jgi:Transglycosylase SLT domain